MLDSFNDSIEDSMSEDWQSLPVYHLTLRVEIVFPDGKSGERSSWFRHVGID